jgi:pilus assembly protein Flp/PilA
MKKLIAFIRSFLEEDDGAQVLEYALIIAVICLTMVIALRDLTGPNFSGFVNRVAVCLSNAPCL